MALLAIGRTVETQYCSKITTLLLYYYHFLRKGYDKMQSALVLCGGSSVPDDDGGDEGGPGDGSVEMPYHCQLLQLPKEVHPELCLF